MGDVTGTPIILWKMLEPATGVLVSDSAETLDDLDADGATNSRPPVTQGGPTGFERNFDGATPTALEVVDVFQKVRLTRSMTVQFSARLDLAAQDAALNPGTIISNGFRDSAPEDLQFLVELEVVSLALRTVRVKMLWEDSAGVLTTNTGDTFTWPLVDGGDPHVLITVVREWIDDTEVLVRYYVDELFLSEESNADGDIGGAEGATILVGVRGDGAGAYENYYEGNLAGVAIFPRVMSGEEVRQIARRAVVHGPDGYDLVRRSVPKNAWSIDPSSIVQREFFIEGQGWGVVLGKIAELREDFLPDRAWFSLEDWERIMALPPNPSDTLTQRRNRILSALRTIEGHSIGGLQNALTEVFDLDADDIEILEFDHFLLDDFAIALAAFWQSEDWGSHTIAVAAGALTITAVIATAHRWEDNGASAGTEGAPFVMALLDGNVRDAEPSNAAEFSTLISAESFTTDDETLIGGAFYNAAANSLIVFGLFRTGAAIRLGSMVITAGVNGAVTDHGAAPARPFHLNMKFIGGTSYELATAPSGDQNDLTAVVTRADGPANPGFALLGAFGLVAGGPTASESLTYDDFRLHTPNGLAPFSWYAFRDPILPGSPDMPGARKVVRRVKPAYSQASAVQVRALLADDVDSLLDDGPLGE